MTRLWSLEAKQVQSPMANAASCALNLLGSDRIFAAELHTSAYPTSNQQPKPEVGQ